MKFARHFLPLITASPFPVDPQSLGHYCLLTESKTLRLSKKFEGISTDQSHGEALLQGSLFYPEDRGIRGLERCSGFLCPPNISSTSEFLSPCIRDTKGSTCIRRGGKQRRELYTEIGIYEREIHRGRYIDGREIHTEGGIRGGGIHPERGEHGQVIYTGRGILKGEIHMEGGTHGGKHIRREVHTEGGTQERAAQRHRGDVRVEEATCGDDAGDIHMKGMFY